MFTMRKITEYTVKSMFVAKNLKKVRQKFFNKAAFEKKEKKRWSIDSVQKLQFKWTLPNFDAGLISLVAYYCANFLNVVI